MSVVSAYCCCSCVLIIRHDFSLWTSHNGCIVLLQSTIVKPSENAQVPPAQEWGNLKIIPTNRSSSVKVHLTIKSLSISPGSKLFCYHRLSSRGDDCTVQLFHSGKTHSTHWQFNFLKTLFNPKYYCLKFTFKRFLVRQARFASFINTIINNIV